jgi:hypothetical protein
VRIPFRLVDVFTDRPLLVGGGVCRVGSGEFDLPD